MKFKSLAQKPIDTLTFIGLLVATSIARIIPLPLPNLEPILTVTMPASKTWGALGAALFASLAYASKDFIQARLGWWSLYGAIAYAVVAFIAFGALSKTQKRLGTKTGAPSRTQYALTATVGTLTFDLVTALLFGWQFHQTLTQTLIGQVPFTLYHLAGNLALGVVLSPVIFAFLQPKPFPALHATGTAYDSTELR